MKNNISFDNLQEQMLFEDGIRPAVVKQATHEILDFIADIDNKGDITDAELIQAVNDALHALVY